MGAKTLSKSDIKKLNEKTNNFFGKEFFNKKDFVQLVDVPFKYLLVNKEPRFFYNEDKLVPFLKFLYKDQFLKEVVVDMGAVKFICNGADIMRPGITSVDENIRKGEIIVIIDEKNKKPLVVGESLFSGSEIVEKKEGSVIKNLHFVSDDKWKSYQ